MFLDIFFRKRKKADKKEEPAQDTSIIQEEYVAVIEVILQSPLWDGTDEQIYQSLPGDLTQATIDHAKRVLS